jgi:DNA-binding NarL/FixJ family response regulator
MTDCAKIRLLIADDHPVIREGLKSLVAGTGIMIVAEVATGEAAVASALEHELELVLLDVRMASGDGLAALECIRRAKPDLPVLIFPHFDDLTYTARAMALGARGYLLKGCSHPELIAALRGATAGKRLWTRGAERRIARALAVPRPAVDA